MTREQAEQIARKHFGAELPHYIADWVVPAIMEAAAIERADEREACAKLCEGIQRECGECPETASNCAEAIRARAEQ